MSHSESLVDLPHRSNLICNMTMRKKPNLNVTLLAVIDVIILCYDLIQYINQPTWPSGVLVIQIILCPHRWHSEYHIIASVFTCIWKWNKLNLNLNCRLLAFGFWPKHRKQLTFTIFSARAWVNLEKQILFSPGLMFCLVNSKLSPRSAIEQSEGGHLRAQYI